MEDQGEAGQKEAENGGVLGNHAGNIADGCRGGVHRPPSGATFGLCSFLS